MSSAGRTSFKRWLNRKFLLRTPRLPLPNASEIRPMGFERLSLGTHFTNGIGVNTTGTVITTSSFRENAPLGGTTDSY